MLIRRDGEAQWRGPSVTQYSNESELQDIVARSPDLLPLAAGTAVVTVREVPIPDTGSLDVLCVDAEGNIGLVECKLASNPDIRREVVGQVFAYAAGLWRMTYAALDAAVKARIKKHLGDAVAEVAAENWEEEAFRDRVTENLIAGRFRLIFAVDTITDELKRIVLYLNQHMGADVDVMAVQLGYVKDAGVEVLLPETFGEESAAEGRPQRTWAMADLQAAWTRCCPPESVGRVERVLNYVLSLEEPRPFWGNGSQPSVSFWVGGDDPWLAVSFYSDSIAVNFEWLLPYRSEAELAALANGLASVPEVAERLVGLKEAGFRRRPGLKVAQVFVSDANADAFIAALDAHRPR